MIGAYFQVKCVVCILDELGTDGVEFSRKGAIGRKVEDAIGSLVNVKEYYMRPSSCLFYWFS